MTMPSHANPWSESDARPRRSDGGNLPPVRLAAALGDADRERQLLPALLESGDFVLVDRCLTAEQLLSSFELGGADAALVAADLHRLTEAALAELIREGVPLVLLAPAPDAEHWQSFVGQTLPIDADAERVRRALLDAMHGERIQPPVAPARPEPDPTGSSDAETIESAAAAATVFAIAGGHGSPGRTTLAVNLAVALGAVAPTILVDADLFAPSVAVHLDLDPTRNLRMLAHAAPSTSREWESALAEEAQPLGPWSPHGLALCGVPKPELRTAVSPQFVERLLAELRVHFRYVIVDAGADFFGVETVLYRTALSLADQALFVAATDLGGLWHARRALPRVRADARLPSSKIALVLNRHDRRHHYGRAEVEWALGLSAVAVIPHDHDSAQRALAAQRPLILARRSRAARALRGLAERMHGGRLAPLPELTGNGRLHRRRRAIESGPIRQSLSPAGNHPASNTVSTDGGGRHGDDVVSVR